MDVVALRVSGAMVSKAVLETLLAAMRQSDRVAFPVEITDRIAK